MVAMENNDKTNGDLIHTNKFSDIGWNEPFLVQLPEFVKKWAVRLDDSRFTYIGENGAHFPESSMLLFFERKSS